jgi:ubiquinone/menaquinone biosynthesis C-methylase UbiE
MSTTSTVYDELYKQVDFTDTPFGGNRDYIEWLKTKINKRIASYLKPGRVLDAGGGYGHLKYFLSDDQIYHNLEYSKEIQKYDDSYYKVIGTGLSLPFKNNTFENVVSGDVLEHVPDKIKYLEECFRVLKNDGVFVINTPTIGSPAERFYRSIWFYIFMMGAFFNKLFKHKEYIQVRIPNGVIDEASDEGWLYSTLKEIGFTFVDGKRTAIHIPFSLDGKVWRKIVDTFIDESYGNSILFACIKDTRAVKSRNLKSMNVVPKKDNYFEHKIKNISKKIDLTFLKK